MALFLELYANAHRPTMTGRAAGTAAGAAARPCFAAPVALPRRVRTPVTDLGIRIMGGGLIGIAVAALRMLAVLAHGPAHPATPLELVVALIGVATGGIGNILLWQGQHINDECDVADRWRRCR